MRRTCLLLLVSVLVTLIVAPASPTVNNSPTPALNPDSHQAQWPIPPWPKYKFAPAAENLHAQGWPIPPPPPKKIRSAEKDLMAQGWPIPPPPPKKVRSAEKDLMAQG